MNEREQFKVNSYSRLSDQQSWLSRIGYVISPNFKTNFEKVSPARKSVTGTHCFQTWEERKCPHLLNDSLRLKCSCEYYVKLKGLSFGMSRKN